MEEKSEKGNTYLQTIYETMKKNEEFLEREAKDVLDEVIYFVSKDIIENVKFAAKRKENLTNWAMGSYVIHILQPFGYAIYPDLLIGNLPVCFFELRVLLESLIKHYYADTKYPSHLFFEQKLRLLEIDSKQKTITELAKEIDKLLMIENRCQLLWQRISEEWIHSKGILERITNRIITEKDIPTWGLILPGPYTKTELRDIKEFQKALQLFRAINNEALKSWGKFLRNYG